jgi:IMP dehydrogenase
VNIQIGRGKSARRAYGIDEIALVPGGKTLDPSLADTSWTIGSISREIPIIASAMDGVVDVNMAALLSDLGALGVINLDGIQTRYKDTAPILDKIASVGKDEFVGLMQKLYAEPVKPELIEQRIKEIKAKGAIAAASSTPVNAEKYGFLAAQAGCDLFFVQSTVVSTTHLAPDGFSSLNLAEFCQKMPIPVILGNCVTYEVTIELLQTGAAAILVGIGPGAACTSRGVLGVGIPQATAVADCAAARDDFMLRLVDISRLLLMVV